MNSIQRFKKKQVQLYRCNIKGSINMEFVLVKDLKKEFITVIVEDQMSKDLHFNDSEINGWILVKEGEEITAYELYRRCSFNGKNYDELAYLVDQPIALESILDSLLWEASFISQKEEVETFLKTNLFFEKLLLERKIKELEENVKNLQEFKNDTVWRLTEEDFVMTAADSYGLNPEEANDLLAEVDLDRFNIDNWAEYVSYFISFQIGEEKEDSLKN